MRPRKILAAVACAGMVSAGLVATASAASASGPCGSGYYLIRSYPIKTSGGTRKGTLEVFWNSGTRKNCVLTYGYGSWANTKNFKIAGIALHGESFKSDRGDYTYYAGPVYQYAPHQCIDVVGYVDDAIAALGPLACN
ncbi:hypothetical protein ABZ806_37255 [Spirillospora sp. NPDC047418]